MLSCKSRWCDIHHDDTKFVKCRWKADEDEVLVQAVTKYKLQGWEVIAENVHGRT